MRQVKRRLENLENVQIVTVEKNDTLSYGACEWTVTFDTELGDLPMLEVTSGRLTGNHTVPTRRGRFIHMASDVGVGTSGLILGGRVRSKGRPKPTNV